ncbi:uncharacterized protein LOC109846623, partial [Asparagus officinalis]|uniref:uncharacterized protein LOC109846623 n=1 Tax=Asparagus officinalis TaxID=4686 RepID=UPI00098E01A9
HIPKNGHPWSHNLHLLPRLPLLHCVLRLAYLNHNADCSFSLPSNPTAFANAVTKITNNATTTNTQEEEEEEEEVRVEDQAETNVSHIVFGIAATSKFWDTRKEYIEQWWRPKSTRGIVWLDRNVRTYRNESLPDIRVSSNTSRFPYKHKRGSRSALRISRIVSETLRLGLGNVRWLVMGDDDTVFVVDNVVRLLKGLDHRGFYYVGSSSESHIQNLLFSYNMAYGGGGFAISYALAVELEKMQDGCMGRYAGLYGSDDRIHACMAELGVPLMKHPGFHQYDIYGDPLGLLAAHPVAPLISLHHVDAINPIFPDTNRPDSIRRLFESINQDSASILQQSFCYDHRRQWSISISWGYVVQITRGILSPRELELPARTFVNWYRGANYFAYSFSTRPVARHPCQKPFTYYVSSVRYSRATNQTVSRHLLHGRRFPGCRWKQASPETIKTVVVFKRPDPFRWDKSPRRDCCKILSSGKATMHVSVSNCEDGEYAGS